MFSPWIPKSQHYALRPTSPATESRMAYHPFKWPRTDADPSRWPAVGRQGNPDSWHDRLAPTDKKYELYERKVGDHVASKMNLPGSGEPWTIV